MIEIVLVLVATFGGGFYVGHQNPSVSCLSQPQIEANCTPLVPLQGDDFGATTKKLIEVAGQYNKCSAAAHASVK